MSKYDTVMYIVNKNRKVADEMHENGVKEKDFGKAMYFFTISRRLSEESTELLNWLGNQLKMEGGKYVR